MPAICQYRRKKKREEGKKARSQMYSDANPEIGMSRASKEKENEARHEN